MKNIISRLKRLFTYVDIIPKGFIWHNIPLGCNIHMDELDCSNLHAKKLSSPKNIIDYDTNNRADRTIHNE